MDRQARRTHDEWIALRCRLAEPGAFTELVPSWKVCWKHVNYPGWIHRDEVLGNLLVVEIHTKLRDHEWQMLQTFIGYLDRHLGDQIESISARYRVMGSV